MEPQRSQSASSVPRCTSNLSFYCVGLTLKVVQIHLDAVFTAVWIIYFNGWQVNMLKHRYLTIQPYRTSILSFTSGPEVPLFISQQGVSIVSDRWKPPFFDVCAYSRWWMHAGLLLSARSQSQMNKWIDHLGCSERALIRGKLPIWETGAVVWRDKRSSNVFQLQRKGQLTRKWQYLQLLQRFSAIY